VRKEEKIYFLNLVIFAPLREKNLSLAIPAFLTAAPPGIIMFP
jgi:hypothetical protein